MLDINSPFFSINFLLIFFGLVEYTNVISEKDEAKIIISLSSLRLFEHGLSSIVDLNGQSNRRGPRIKGTSF